jgi:hypothetical protein
MFINITWDAYKYYLGCNIYLHSSNLILSTWRGIENISENVYYNNKENSKISYIPKTKKILKKKLFL